MFHCTLLIIQGVLEGSECQCEWSLPPASSAKEATISAAFTHLNHLGHVFDLLVVCSSNTFLTVPITQSGKNQREGENMYQVMSFSNAINMDTGAYHLERPRYPSVRCGAVQNMQRPNPFFHQSFALLCVIPYQSSDIITCIPPPFLHPASTPAQHQHHQPPPPEQLPQNP